MNNSVSVKVSHHNLYSPDIPMKNNHDQYFGQSKNSSNSQSSTQQSFNFDKFTIDDTNIQSDQMNLTACKNMLPSFFSSNHEVKISMKQVYEVLLTRPTNYFFYIIFLLAFVLVDNKCKINRTNSSNEILNYYFTVTIILFYFQFRYMCFLTNNRRH